MPDTPDYLALYEKIGDIQATLRVVKHETSNTSAKLDSLATLVVAQGHVAADVEKLKAEVQELKIEKYRRDGAIGLLGWLAKNWPIMLAILATIIASLWGNGKLG
jgi:hypothetical protein